MGCKAAATQLPPPPPLLLLFASPSSLDGADVGSCANYHCVGRGAELGRRRPRPSRPELPHFLNISAAARRPRL
jgi:hypothetical protein